MRGLLIGLAAALSGCQLGYIINSGYDQAKLLSQTVSNEEALKSGDLDEETKRKIRLIEEVKSFSETRLGLAKTRNYESFVQLDRPYVSYIVSAAYAFELTPHFWRFPIVGSVPYKGFFDLEKAKKEARVLEQKGLDTHVRGASAFSTLGYFRDPILSSMLRYPDPDLVNLIIHETVHSTLYIENNADFNERLAVFLGNKGTEIFYTSKEGAHSPVLKKIADDHADDRAFSDFLTAEIKALESWYKKHGGERNEKAKADYLEEIQFRFRKDVLKTLRTDSYRGFATQKLNNASLLALNTYVGNLTDFELAYEAKGSDYKLALDYFKSLEKEKGPEKALSDFVKSNSSDSQK